MLNIFLNMVLAGRYMYSIYIWQINNLLHVNVMQCIAE